MIIVVAGTSLFRQVENQFYIFFLGFEMISILAGQWKRRKLEIPPSQITRPTSQRCKEAVFNILEHSYDLDWGKQKVLDAFAGSGGFGFECLSRGALFCHFYENNKQAFDVMMRNKHALGVSDSAILQQKDILKSLPPPMPYTLVFLDPPYDMGLEESLLKKMKEEMGWITHESLILVERRSKTKIKKEPEGFDVLQTRQYGEAEILFLRST